MSYLEWWFNLITSKHRSYRISSGTWDPGPRHAWPGSWNDKFPDVYVKTRKDEIPVKADLATGISYEIVQHGIKSFVPPIKYNHLKAKFHTPGPGECGSPGPCVIPAKRD
jgi:hypothetical protein